jgi:cell division protein FtsQ
MISISSVSSTDLKQRRKELKNQRRIRFFQSVWRTLLLGSLTGGAFWVITLPNWVIRQGDQIKIQGNQFLSEEAVLKLMSMSYPQSIFQVETQELINNLEATGPIAQATITRNLFPPSLILEVKERQPVAIAMIPQQAKNPNKSENIGFLDEQGVWMPKSSYSNNNPQLQFPNLKIIGDLQQYQAYWPEFYQTLMRGNVKINEVNWQNPNNVILKTEIGTVHLGAYSSLFPEQLVVLARLKDLPKQVNQSQVAYIDLTNPEFPSLRMAQGHQDNLEQLRLQGQVSQLP